MYLIFSLLAHSVARSRSTVFFKILTQPQNPHWSHLDANGLNHTKFACFKGQSSKSSGKHIVAPNLCFLTAS